MVLEVLRELGNVHWALAGEVDLLYDLSDFNVDNLLLNVLSVLQHGGLGLPEGVDSLLAFLDVLIDGQGEPVVVLGSLVHVLLESLDLTLHEFLLDRFKAPES